MISVSAPAKIHLTSAHIVVYGKPALLCSINLRAKASIKSKKNSGKIKIIAKDLLEEASLSGEEIIAKTQKARLLWEEFSQTNNVSLLKNTNQNKINLIIYALGETLLFLNKELKDVEIELSSQIPIGGKFGSSASVAAAVCGSVFSYLGVGLDLEKINRVVYEVEKKIHGFPSGADNTVVVYGGLLWFRKETEFLKLFQKITVPVMPKFTIVNSGIPEESTGEMVSLVRKLFTKRPKYTEKIFHEMENLKKHFLNHLYTNSQSGLMALMKKDERNLEKLGVVSEQTKLIIRDLEALGASVGVSGAAGRKAGSGALVVLSPNEEKIKEYCRRRNLAFYDVSFQAEGLRRENEG